jgi:benzylsuccinate CoA-transferase BbsE subunit
MLSPYRALDLTNESGLYCGKILADLGCDVVKVERPGGDTARSIGPFYDDTPHPEKSLFWFAYNTNKRSVTLNIETTDGQEILKRLVKGADFVIESFPPGYMDRLGLGYPELSQINPRIIVTSISPFGQNGPYKDYQASDIVVMAMSGFMYLCGERDQAPVRFSVPQTYLHAGIEAAEGTLVAHYHRERTGEGQHVDVSAQESIIWLMLGTLFAWLEDGYIWAYREGNYLFRPDLGTRQRWMFPCKDGAVGFLLLGGHIGARTMRALAEWMKGEGMSDDFLMNMNWADWDRYRAGQDEIDRIEQALLHFFQAHTKEELYQGANKRDMLLAPVWNLEDLAHNPQLGSREFWVKINYPELRVNITYPAIPFKASAIDHKTPHRAPLIGEHNEEIYIKELGLTREELVILKQGGVI